VSADQIFQLLLFKIFKIFYAVFGVATTRVRRKVKTPKYIFKNTVTALSPLRDPVVKTDVQVNLSALRSFLFILENSLSRGRTSRPPKRSDFDKLHHFRASIPVSGIWYRVSVRLEGRNVKSFTRTAFTPR